MDFNEATDQMMKAGVTLAEMAEFLGVAHGSVRQARLDPSAGSYRRPPEGWRLALEKLARARGDELRELADALRDASASE